MPYMCSVCLDIPLINSLLCVPVPNIELESECIVVLFDY